jgi:hypothetical protein
MTQRRANSGSAKQAGEGASQTMVAYCPDTFSDQKPHWYIGDSPLTPGVWSFRKSARPVRVLQAGGNCRRHRAGFAVRGPKGLASRLDRAGRALLT